MRDDFHLDLSSAALETWVRAPPAVRASVLISTAVTCLVAKWAFQQGSAVLMHLHKSTWRTHQTITIRYALLIATNFCVTCNCDSLLRLLPQSLQLASVTLPFISLRVSEGVLGAVVLHLGAGFLAWSVAGLYKILVIFVKAWQYRQLDGQWQWLEKERRPGTPERILIVHASVGAGHKRAAQAIEASMRAQLEHAAAGDGSSPDIRVLDIVETQEWLLKAVYKKGFMFAVTRDWGAALIGYLFDQGNKRAPDGKSAGSFIQRLAEEAFMLDFVELLFRYKPDVIVQTHFLGLKVVSHLRQRMEHFRVPQVCCVTDFDVHAYWACRPCERFFVARTTGQLTLKHLVGEDVVVQLSGIPIMPVFSSVKGPASCLADLGLTHLVGGPHRRPLVLMMSGGKDVFDLYRQALAASTPIALVVITGRHADTREALAKIPVPSRHRVHLEGFTKEMHKYLGAADLIITKPGGLTTAESLAMGCAMVICNSLPGQELRNAEYVLESGCGIKVNDIFLLSHRLDVLLRDWEMPNSNLRSMQRVARRIGERHLHAADDVASYVLGMRVKGEGAIQLDSIAGD